jgi:hypothetical protein
MIFWGTLGVLFFQIIPVDLSKVDPNGRIRVVHQENSLIASWSAPDGSPLSCVLRLTPEGAIFSSLKAGGAELAREIRPRFILTTGTRVTKPGERYVFFDKPASRPTQVHPAAMKLESARAESEGERLSLHFPGLAAGPFRGELVITLFAGSPLVFLEAALSLDEKDIAYIYDFVLEGDWTTVAWKDLSDAIVRVRPEGDPKPVAVRNRAIFAEGEAGTIALFPPPHAFFYPRDYATNFKFCQVGARLMGLRQDAQGGPGHQGQFIPWFDAPPGRVQRMGACLLLSPEKVEPTLERLKKYTHGDRFIPLEGRLTFSSHWHCRLAVDEMAGHSRARETVETFKALGVNLLHLAEFHGDGNPLDPGPKRLPQLEAMFELCRKYSDRELLLIPGEEANAHLGGHWVYLFPKPVFLTLVRGQDVPFLENVPPYGLVYHAGNAQEMIDVLRREKALAWTAHPRIKASAAFPDSYKDAPWYQSGLWLGGAWKAMPGDLSQTGLGTRVLDLLDDMNSWGQRKVSPGEVDCFVPDRSQELYASMNVNYLHLSKMPSADDWTPVLGALRQGDFFVTTGEVLIHSFEVRDGKAVTDLEWTFPLRSVELVASDGKTVTRRSMSMAQTGEFGRRTFEWPLPSGLSWVRLEAWDVFRDGAFTQPLWLQP